MTHPERTNIRAKVSTAAPAAASGATVCDAYEPPTGRPENSGLCARCGMYDWRHRQQPATSG